MPLSFQALTDITIVHFTLLYTSLLAVNVRYCNLQNSSQSTNFTVPNPAYAVFGSNVTDVNENVQVRELSSPIMDYLSKLAYILMPDK